MPDESIDLRRIQHRIDETANWVLANPILELGEVAYEIPASGPVKQKVGDGETAWNSLDYLLTAGATGPAGNPVTVHTLSIPSIVGVGRVSMRCPVIHDGPVLGVIAMADTPPLSRSMIIDVNAGVGDAASSTLFTTQGNRPTIGAGAHTSGLCVPDAGVADRLVNDYFDVEVDQAGRTGQVTHVVTEYVTATASTSFTVPRPTGATVGDLHVVAVEIFGSTAKGGTVTPTGTGAAQWTKKAEQDATTAATHKGYVFWRIDDGSAGPWTFTLGASDTHAASSSAFRGAVNDGSDPFGAFAVNVGSSVSTTFTAPTVTPTEPDGTLAVWGIFGGASGAQTFGGSLTSAGLTSRVAVGYKELAGSTAATGAIANTVATSQFSVTFAGVILAENNPAGAGANVTVSVLQGA